MSEEEWRPVIGYEGLYSVSDKGRVRSEERMVRGRCGLRRSCSKVLKGGLDHWGYPRVNVYRSGVRATKKVHTLVAAAFLGRRPDGTDTDHIDRCRSNNSVDNLRYVSRTENQANTAGSRVPTPCELVCSKTGVGHWAPSVSALARGLGLNVGNVLHVRAGRKKSVKGYCLP